MSVSKSSRHREIIARVARDGGVEVARLAAHFGVSDMTIRRDLTELGERGQINRTYGGAESSRVGVAEFLFREKAEHNHDRKQAVARLAATRVTPGMHLSLDTGTTTLEVARAVADVERLTVLTTSLLIAAALHSRNNIDLVLLGGNVRRHSPDLSGPLTVDNLRRFRVDLALLGADAVTPQGVFTTDLQIAEINAALAEQAEQVGLVVDSSKFRAGAFVRSLPLSRLTFLVTDSQCPAAVRKWLKRHVREVCFAKV